MRLPLSSRALRRRSRLLHPVYRRAPLDGAAGLRSPVSCDPVRARGDKVFGERSSSTAGINIDTEADDYFPNDDFFPDISNLFNDMALNSDNVNVGSSSGPHYSPVSFASSLKPLPFEGVNYKRWRARAILWLTTMRCFDATNGKPEGELTPLEEKSFEDADTLLRGAIISVLGKNIVDSYFSISTGKDMWDAIEAKFGVSDAGNEQYIMEQFYDFKMTNERSIVEYKVRWHALAPASACVPKPCGPSSEGPGPPQPRLFPLYRVARRCSPVGFSTPTHSRTPGGTIFDINPIAIYIRDGGRHAVTYDDLTEDLKKKYDEVKALRQADLFIEPARTASGGKGSTLKARSMEWTCPPVRRTHQVPASGD
ncbi:hypothetical protein QYE76_045655 [Lolium multiflorum]|uniref:Retrotransposon protein, putative, Ty1-copia subclass n=1 Tax=Lolium multiflorum TaxID=4521 RepID=A0AAD8TN68_LOLMU|nr:hypothetical protein QYE76_045655 [Lolium multiflorum]